MSTTSHPNVVFIDALADERLQTGNCSVSEQAGG
jgi:hypothetical protein